MRIFDMHSCSRRWAPIGYATHSLRALFEVNKYVCIACASSECMTYVAYETHGGSALQVIDLSPNEKRTNHSNHLVGGEKLFPKLWLWWAKAFLQYAIFMYWLHYDFMSECVHYFNFPILLRELVNFSASLPFYSRKALFCGT